MEDFSLSSEENPSEPTENNNHLSLERTLFFTGVFGSGAAMAALVLSFFMLGHEQPQGPGDSFTAHTAFKHHDSRPATPRPIKPGHPKEHAPPPPPSAQGASPIVGNVSEKVTVQKASKEKKQDLVSFNAFSLKDKPSFSFIAREYLQETYLFTPLVPKGRSP